MAESPSSLKHKKAHLIEDIAHGTSILTYNTEDITPGHLTEWGILVHLNSVGLRRFLVIGAVCNLLDNVEGLLHELASTADISLVLIHQSQVQVQP